jgi:hypothetical protein
MEARQVKVLVMDAKPHFKDYPLISFLIDAETEEPVTQSIHHRDMRQVRSYYNGFSAGVWAASADKTITMTIRVGLLVETRVYEIPVSFGFRQTQRADLILLRDD